MLWLIDWKSPWLADRAIRPRYYAFYRSLWVAEDGVTAVGQAFNWCTGCVDGKTGTLFWRVFIDGSFAQPEGTFLGKWEVLGGTGDLASATGGGDVFFPPVHYVGKIVVPEAD